MLQKLFSLGLVLFLLLGLTPSILAASPAAAPAQVEPAAQVAIFRGVSTAEKFDVSPPLRSITPLPVEAVEAADIPELATGLEGLPGPQDVDQVVQFEIGAAEIPAPLVSFDGPSNIANVSPPDPVGDVGPNHYVAMSNLYFAIYSKTGTLLYGPAANNTLWVGLGNDCETDNSGDPIVVYDQFADRWILTQFTASGPTYYNCVAISTSGDPTGTYYRYAFSTGSNFPDYPKYGVWHDAYYISTREFSGGSTFAGVGAYAVNRAQMIAGNPTPQVLSFLVPPGSTVYNIGDGLLPTDVDGLSMPPAGSPNYFVGTMDNGGPYGAPQDALTLWKFHADFATPVNSTFTLANTIPVAAFDSIYPCGTGRECIPQPGTATMLDILSYRQRPLWRLAYRNYGTHESLVTNQAVEAAPSVAGVRWYEIRDPNGTPVIYQQGTYAPGISDGIHRWMGSIAMDAGGNMALGYSASNGTTTYPSSWYTGRLAGDPLGTLPQGEGSIINGTGSQTGSNRWGDYTSMNVDPVDDCTFWYVNQYIPTTSAIGWRLRIGSFKFPSCSLAPDFSLSATPDSQEICAPDDAVYNIDVYSAGGFSDAVTLSTAGNPGTAGFVPNPVTPPPGGTSSSTLTISGAPAGMSHFDVTGTSGATSHSIEVGLIVRDAAPGAPVLTSPADGAKSVSNLPTFTWSEDLQATTYSLQVATDPAFTNVVVSASGLMTTSYTPATLLNANTLYYWRVWADNSCGTGANSAVSAFVTANRETITACSFPAVAIPDNNTTGVFSEQTLTTLGGIIDLNVSVRATHTYVGDLDFTIQNMGTGSSAMVIDRPGVPASTFGCAQNHINAVLDDQASQPVEGQCATSTSPAPPPYAIDGTFTPNNPLSVFAGQTLANTWRMTARDLVGTDTGTLSEWCLEATVEAAPFPAAFADPADSTCAGNSPCFFGPGAVQQALNAVASGGQVTVLGDHTINNSLTCVGDIDVVGASGSSIVWGGGAGDMFTAWNCNLTLKGLALDGGAAANVFNQVGAGVVTAYANNIGNYASAYSGGGAPAIGHNFWGSKDAAETAPTGMPAGEWPKRLGSTVATWADSSTGSVSLGGTSLSGGAGTVAIVGFGRGTANAPFDNGISGHVDAMCSEFYDAFTVGGTGPWTLVLPVDAAPAGCVTNTLNQNRLFKITDVTQCTPADAECWDLAAGATHAGSDLVLAGLNQTDLDGTHFVAGNSGGLDPTTVKLRSFSSQAISRGLAAWVLAGLLALAVGAAWTARKLNQRA